MTRALVIAVTPFPSNRVIPPTYPNPDPLAFAQS
jgi:hypothetical protein